MQNYVTIKQAIEIFREVAGGMSEYSNIRAGGNLGIVVAELIKIKQQEYNDKMKYVINNNKLDK